MRNLILCLAIALSAGACGEPLAADAPGDAIFAAICARCHGGSLEGAIGPQLGGSDAPSVDQPESYFIQTVTRGQGRMPSFGTTLSEDQIQRVVDFILEQQGR